MAVTSSRPYGLRIREPLGLAHERQILTIPEPPELDDQTGLVDTATGRRFPLQRATEGQAHLLLSLEPGESLELRLCDEVSEAAAPDFRPVTAEDESPEIAVLANGRCALRVALGAWRATDAAGVACFEIPGPVLGLRAGPSGPWRGRTFFDTRDRVLAWSGEWLERGPLRTVFRYRLELAGGGSYEMRLTLDAEQCFARVEETCDTHESDQLVWDFEGADLPSEALLLDGGAGYARRALQIHLDERIGRMVCWTQYAQINGLDGAAFAFPGADDALGFVTLDGGAWRNRRLNALEFWTRRWRDDDPLTRRLLPPEAKADGMPSPERIPARGEPACRPHFSVEGWLGKSRRVFALVLAPLAEMLPPEEREAGSRAPRIGHFDESADRERYRLQQGLLRRLHAQRGLMPLQKLAAMTFAWPDENALREVPPTPDPVRQREAALPPAELARRIDDALRARVFGFWDGAGAASANCVAGRPIPFYMTCLAPLLAQGAIDAETAERWRSGFAFLASLYADEGYYAGPASMLPPTDPDSLEPLIEGMSNQNFYTDVIVLCGTAAEVFPENPEADAWRRLFEEGWSRQLDYHRYPDSGVWEESHTYYQHVLVTVLPLFLLRKANGRDDAFADPRLHSLLAGALRQVTPPDADTGGRRHLVAFGDHNADPNGYAWVYGTAAVGLAPHAPELAAQLAWLHREMGGSLPLSTEPAAPRWTDEAVQGLGHMFRGRNEAAGDVLLALRAGAAWGHHHEDDGSVQLFAFGRCLVGDAARGHLQEGGTKHSTVGHSRWTLRDDPPTNFRWRFNRGWIAASGSEPWSHAVAWTPAYLHLLSHNRPLLLPQPVAHCRAVVRIAPLRYLVLDRSETSSAQVVRFHLLDGECVIEGSAAHVRASDCRVSVLPLFEVGAPSVQRIAGIREPHIATQALAWDCGTRGQLGFLLDAGTPDSRPPRCTPSDGGAVIECDAGIIEIVWTPRGAIMREPATQRELNLDLACSVATAEPR